MEGHLPCVKFLVSEGPSPTHILGARNDNGETPKMLSQQFYKDHVVEYITNIEWERDHPEESESKCKHRSNTLKQGFIALLWINKSLYERLSKDGS